MKKLVLAVVIILFILPACNKNDKFPQWSGIGTIEKLIASADEFVIILDGGQKLVPNKVIVNNDYKNGDRIFVKYSITKTVDANNYEVDLYDIDRILTKNIIQLTANINDSIGNDPVYMNKENIWISNNYINFIFSYYGAYKIHLINLVKLYENTHTANGRLILEFRHNSHSDYSNYLMNGVVSFNLESLKETNLDSVQFVVRVKEYHETSLEWEGTYIFNDPLKSTKGIAVLPKNNNHSLLFGYLK
ncbi:MAG: NigD-like N-terminal domain-containing protein [Bacteroidetes bacterium]|nr:NigD-like N-terminal domain-containing protein [Bacteroidota bacterium]